MDHQISLEVTCEALKRQHLISQPRGTYPNNPDARNWPLLAMAYVYTPSQLRPVVKQVNFAPASIDISGRRILKTLSDPLKAQALKAEAMSDEATTHWKWGGTWISLGCKIMGICIRIWQCEAGFLWLWHQIMMVVHFIWTTQYRSKSSLHGIYSSVSLSEFFLDNRLLHLTDLTDDNDGAIVQKGSPSPMSFDIPFVANPAIGIVHQFRRDRVSQVFGLVSRFHT
ncbi:hypothetical protein EDD22DRAFT_1047647 [Suillus occidentalis]|nr:hypothetical protein EDD22DRAFT_1047647 [Suillus occidentalis]